MEELKFATLDLASLIRDVMALVHSDAILNNVRISLELEDNLPRDEEMKLRNLFGSTSIPPTWRP